jgi:hypothetical protein
MSTLRETVFGLMRIPCDGFLTGNHQDVWACEAQIPPGKMLPEGMEIVVSS